MYGSHIHDVIARAIPPAAVSRAMRVRTFALVTPQRNSSAVVTTIMYA